MGRLNLGIAHTAKRWDLKRWCCIHPGTKHEQNQTKTREFIYKTVKKTPDSIASIKSSTHVDPNENHYNYNIGWDAVKVAYIACSDISSTPTHFKWSNEKLSFERSLIGDLVHSQPSAAKKLSLLMVRYILKPDSKLRASFAFLLALFILSFLYQWDLWLSLHLIETFVFLLLSFWLSFLPTHLFQTRFATR